MCALAVNSSTSTPATLSENALKILKKRYLNNGESVDSLWDRVSDGNPHFRRLLEQLRFLPNSPTLFNAGLNNGCTLSACFVFQVSDYMITDRGQFKDDSIVRTREKAILVAKAGGGVGYWFSQIRPRGSKVNSIHRVACGPVAVMRDYHAIHKLTTQGGRRDLAQMGILDCDHADIREFIHCKDEDPQSLCSFNISVGWKDDWLKKIRWETITNCAARPPKNCTGGADSHLPLSQGEINESEAIWLEQCGSAWKHGCPGMFFPDTANRFNPNHHLGLIHATNPCGETPNRSDEPCNLGSISLPCYFDPSNRSIRWNDLEDDIRIATEFLDAILDRNTFPHPDIAAAALLTRKLGLGAMGYADLLALMHIHYDTEEAVLLGSRLAKFFQDVSHDQSEKLAREKGPYAGYDATKTQAPMRRNETSGSIAPTGTIALIAGLDNSQSIEPHYAEEGGADRMTGDGMRLNVEGVRADRFDGFRPKTAHEIPWQWHVRHQAAWQQYTDLGVSKTINLPNSATVADVSGAYQMMYELGCKGGTIFRDGCRDEQVITKRPSKGVFSVPSSGSEIPTTHGASLVESLANGNFTGTTVETRSPGNIDVSIDTPLPSVLRDLGGSSKSEQKGNRRKLPEECWCLRKKFRIAGIKGYIHVGLYEDSMPGEIFVRIHQQGTSVCGMIDAWAIAFSFALQYGAPLEALVAKQEGMRFDPAGLSTDTDIGAATSIVDFVVRWLRKRFLASSNGKSHSSQPIRTGEICPDCGSPAVRESGCYVCKTKGCGWTKCG